MSKRIGKKKKVEVLQSYFNINGTNQFVMARLLSLMTNSQLETLLSEIEENGNEDDLYCAVHECGLESTYVD